MESEETSKMPSLSLEEISAISDPEHAIAISIDHDIPMDNLNSLDEMKQRLRCHFRMKQDGSYKTKVSHFVQTERSSE